MRAGQKQDPTGLAGLQGRVVDFSRALRRAGVPVATSDGLDAHRAAALVDLLDREQLREALAATLVKSVGHRPAFDTLYDVFFPARLDIDGLGDPDPDELDPRDVRDFLADLVEQVLAGDEAAIRALAAEAVAAYARQDRSDGSVGYYRYRVFREINLAGVLRRLLGRTSYEDGSLEQRLAHDEFEDLLRRFREEVDREVRRRTAAERGPEEVARVLVRPLLEDVDFFRVTAEDEAAMRRTIRPLARRLAARLATKRKRATRGRLDARRTLRRALGTGGVPIDPAFRARAPHRPELVLLCDVSGSVASFAKFTLLLCHALAGSFSRVRSFAFIDAVDEVTRAFDDSDFSDALRRLHSEARVVWLDGHSDYGNAFEMFLRDHADALTPRATLIVLGDARNNYRAAAEPALAEMVRRVRRCYWLNPEPAAQWGSGDSIADRYARHTHGMHECRNLRQLSAFIERIGWR